MNNYAFIDADPRTDQQKAKDMLKASFMFAALKKNPSAMVAAATKLLDNASGTDGESPSLEINISTAEAKGEVKVTRGT